MTTKNKILESARRTLQLESEAVAGLIDHIDSQFERIVKSILKSKGRIVVTGVGKSANIAQKIVATMNSTGQPAVFMHAADAIHGDLGNVQKEDIVLCISKSGDSQEIKVLVPLLKSMGNMLIGMVSNSNGFLAKNSTHILFVPIDKEACPNNLAPTTSTTAQLAMGDALAVALMECRGFNAQDFAKYHPGGALGKKLYVKMKDLLGEDSRPMVTSNTSIQSVLIEISAKRLGATAVVDKDELVGIITDGDIRRMLENKLANLDKIKAKEIMGKKPRTIDSKELAVSGFQIMEQHNITQLIVTEGNRYLGIVHLHDILKEGIY